MVVSDRLTHAGLFPALEQATAQLGRKVAPTIYSSKELVKRVKEENAFVTRVLAQPKLWLIGDERDLAALSPAALRRAGTTRHSGARWGTHEPSRATLGRSHATPRADEEIPRGMWYSASPGPT